MSEKTVTTIVQGLLDKGHITAEEAVILLKSEVEAQDTRTAPYCPTYPLGVPSETPYPYFQYTTSTGEHKTANFEAKELIKG